MARTAKRLTARAVETLKKPGMHADGDGLYLVVTDSGQKRWAFVYRRGTKRTEMGLGRLADVTLAEARDKAAALRKVNEAGADPLAAKRQADAEARPKPTFGDVADAFVDAMESGWRNEKHKAQWRQTLGHTAPDSRKVRIDAEIERKHRAALDTLRSTPIDKVDTDQVIAVLNPIWQAKPETASRLRGRIEAVLASATAKGLRTGPNPAQWRNHLDRLLPKRQRLTRGHHAAMPYADVPAFVARLRAANSVSALALEFTILTAARSGETLGATWAEMDLGAKLWTVPAERMKAGRIHRVPLTERCLEILAEVAKLRTDAAANVYVFPGQKRGRPLSPMALEMAMRRMKVTDATPHGFRSAFRDWCGEETDYPRELAEAALAHVVGDQTERAYRRGDALEKRRRLMEAWFGWCCGCKRERDPSNLDPRLD